MLAIVTRQFIARDANVLSIVRMSSCRNALIAEHAKANPMASESIKVQFRSRELLIDEACQDRATAAGCDPVEQRLWEAGFTREAAQRAAQEIAAAPR